MSKKVKAQKVMPSQEIKYCVYALMRLFVALSALKTIGRLCEKCAKDTSIKNALFHNAIIFYGSVFKHSNVGNGKKIKTGEWYVPKRYLELHKRLVDYRDKFVAHFDFEYSKPKLGIGKKGTHFYKLAECPIPDMINEIPEIEQLIQGVLMNLGTQTFPAKKST